MDHNFERYHLTLPEWDCWSFKWTLAEFLSLISYSVAGFQFKCFSSGVESKKIYSENTSSHITNHYCFKIELKNLESILYITAFYDFCPWFWKKDIIVHHKFVLSEKYDHRFAKSLERKTKLTIVSNWRWKGGYGSHQLDNEMTADRSPELNVPKCSYLKEFDNGEKKAQIERLRNKVLLAELVVN